MEYIILDLEFNQPFNFPTGKIYKTVPLCPFEIIQIGAVKVNEDFEVVDKFNSFVRPQIYPRLHPFVEKITDIHKKDLMNQPLFPEVYNRFLKFIGGSDSVFCIWGNDDVKFLFRNLLFHKLSHEELPKRYVNIQLYASKCLATENGTAVGLKTAVTELNIKCDLPFHDALNDAIYTTEVFKLVKPDNIIPIILFPEQFTNAGSSRVRVNTKLLRQNMCSILGKEDLTADERKIAKTAYMYGRDRVFDSQAKPKSNSNNTTNKHKHK